jgi:hypothetical protein
MTVTSPQTEFLSFSKYPTDRPHFFAANRFGLSRSGSPGSAGQWGRVWCCERRESPVVDLSFELIFVDEAVDLHGAEKVADAFPFRNSESDGRVTPYGT